MEQNDPLTVASTENVRNVMCYRCATKHDAFAQPERPTHLKCRHGYQPLPETLPRYPAKLSRTVMARM